MTNRFWLLDWMTTSRTHRLSIIFTRSMRKKPPDLIVALGAPAANFVQRYRPRIFPKTPMLFYAVEARRVQYDQLTENDTVAAAAHDFPLAFETILQVLPDTKVIR